MSSELLFTSAPKGLRHGSGGFCTVLMTAGMPINVIDRLEGLSGYSRLFPPDHPQVNSNPVSLSHQKVVIGGETVSVLSRVSAYGTEYSRRNNKIAHHVTVQPDEMPAAGPAWLLRQRSFMRTEWFGQCETPSSGPAVPRGDQTARICAEWKSVLNDAGWGGIVAEAMLSPDARPLWLIYALEQRDRLLGLIDDSIALLPKSHRWQATFNTYATNIPPDVDCKIRCVPAGTKEAKFASSSGRVIDLTQRQSITSASNWVERARGVSRDEPVEPRVGGGDGDSEASEDAMASSWSGVDAETNDAPPSMEPPSLPPELAQEDSPAKTLLFSGIALAILLGLVGTWVVARQIAGLPIIPNGQPTTQPAPPPSDDTGPTVEDTPATDSVVEPIELATFVVKYDRKQLLSWAAQATDESADLPNPIKLVGRIRLETLRAASAEPEIEGDTGSPVAVSDAADFDPTGQLVSWGGEAMSVRPLEEIRIETTQLTNSAGNYLAAALPRVPETFQNELDVYWAPETGDLIAVCQFDWLTPPPEFAAQAAAYRATGKAIADLLRRFEAIRENEAQLPESFRGLTVSLTTPAARGKDSLLRYLLNIGADTQSLVEQAESTSELLQQKAESSPGSLEKTQQSALLSIVADCGRIATTSHMLEESMRTLEKGQSVEVPDLVFHSTDDGDERRIPIRFHFHW